MSALRQSDMTVPLRTLFDDPCPTCLDMRLSETQPVRLGDRVVRGLLTLPVAWDA